MSDRQMKIINTNIIAGLTLADKVWNDAMETAALHCEDKANSLCAANGESDAWVWPAADKFRQTAADFRAQKRKPVK